MNIFLKKLKERVKAISREKKNNDFYEMCGKECRILDVGVFPETKISDKNISTNHFLKTFRFDPKYYTGLSIDPLDGMEKLYPPGMKFIQYDGRIFPFENKSFEWAYSNAVIEHVGTYEHKLLFLKEMVRVANKVFFTTPNKYFPVDAHTMVFFLHWNDGLFLKWREKNKKWMPKETLNLVSYSEIRRLLKDANVTDFKIKRNRFLGMTMTYSVTISAKDAKSTGTREKTTAKPEVTAKAV